MAIHHHEAFCKKHVMPILTAQKSNPRIACDATVDSFFVFERSERAEFLLPSERNLESRLKFIINKRLLFFSFRLCDQTEMHTIQHVIDRVFNVLMEVLLLEQNGKSIGMLLWNQEIPYLIDDIIRELYYGGASRVIPMQLAYREYADWVFSRLVFGTDSFRSFTQAQLFRLSLAMGTVGSEYKSKTQDQSSCHTNQGKELDHIEMISKLLTLGYACPVMSDYEEELLSALGESISVVWICDDYLESLCDLVFLNRLLSENLQIEIGIVARQQYCDSDIVFHEVHQAIKEYDLDELASAIKVGRVTVFNECPSTGAPRIQTLSEEVSEFIHQSSFVFVKGNRIHEMFQGAINHLCYFGYVLINEFSVSEFGMDAKLTPLILLKARAGEPCWWGFRYRFRRNIANSSQAVLAVPLTTMDIYTQQHRGGTHIQEYAQMLKKRYSMPNPLLCERLDRFTSGI